MWRNYLTVGLRALGKNKVYAFINIFGLSLGIAACLLILTFVRYEFSYDSWLPGAEDAYQVQDFYRPTQRGGEEMKLQMTSFVSGTALEKDFPQIEKRVYISGQGMVFIVNGEAVRPQNAYFTDGNIFDILRAPFVKGDAAHALDDPHALVLSEEEAKARFGKEDPMGKTITVMSDEMREDYRVTGVFKDFPLNSHLRPRAFARFNPQSYFAKNPTFLTSWNSQGGFVYVRLKPGTDANALVSQFPAWEKRNIPNDPADGGPVTNPGDDQDWRLTNIRDIHLGEAQNASTSVGSDKQTIITFAVVALMILGMACINFTNLATARASQRAREVALRKVLGATRRQLIVQFIGESILVSAIATLVALALAEVALRPLNTFLDSAMEIHYLGGEGVLLPVIALAILVGLAGGAYPALYLSRFQPAKVLKANKSAADAEGSGRLRNLLVVSQFAVSIGLIICTAIVYSQTVYARNMDAGYTREGLIQIDGVAAPQIEKVATTLRDEIRRVPGVTEVARTGVGINPGNNSVTTVRRAGQTEPVNLGVYAIEPAAIQALRLKLLAGRNFDENNRMDDATTPSPVDIEAEKALVARGVNVMLSETGVKRLGFKDVQDAIGKQVQVGFTVPEAGNWVPATVVGVVADVRYRSVRQPLQPIIYYYATTNFNRLLVRATGDLKPVRDRIETIWKRLAPEIPFNARDVTEIVHNLYNRDESRAQLFGMFAILSVVIGCLGLFGLAAFTAERRTKEIGIRKVLGARTRDIVQLLVWQFSRPVIVANIIAWPIAWWVMRDWLNQFDLRVPLGPGPFLTAGFVALAIAVLTIGAHAFRVARTNPVKALRYE